MKYHYNFLTIYLTNLIIAIYHSIYFPDHSIDAALNNVFNTTYIYMEFNSPYFIINISSVLIRYMLLYIQQDQ